MQKSNQVPIIGGLVAAIGAGLCCAGPLILLLLGISGSWISNLTLLEPFRPIFIFMVVSAFGFAGWKIYRPIEECADDTACAVPQVRRGRQAMFWISLLIALLFVTSNYWIVWVV
nr:mercuric transporter MerT family protein [uncultured Glaciecola sp.]